MGAYFASVTARFNQRRVEIDPADANAFEQAAALASNGAKLRVHKLMYPQVEKSADRLKWARRRFLSDLGALYFSDGLILLPEDRLERFDAGLEELRQRFAEEAALLKAGLDEAREALRSQIVNAIAQCGSTVEYALERWEGYYSERFYTAEDFDPPKFGVSAFYQKLDLGGPAADAALQGAVFSLSEEIEQLSQRIADLTTKDPQNGRLRPENRMAELEEAQAQLDWLEGLLQVKQDALRQRLQSLSQQLQDFQAAA